VGSITCNPSNPLKIDFLDSLSIKERALILKNIEKLIEYKNNNYSLSPKFTKYLKDGIFELKVELQNKTSRSLYFYEKNQMIIFTNGFIKKTQKTPPKEIEKAKAIKEAYQNE
jgi:phage-related protein